MRVYPPLVGAVKGLFIILILKCSPLLEPLLVPFEQKWVIMSVRLNYASMLLFYVIPVVALEDSFNGHTCLAKVSDDYSRLASEKSAWFF